MTGSEFWDVLILISGMGIVGFIGWCAFVYYCLGLRD